MKTLIKDLDLSNPDLIRSLERQARDALITIDEDMSCIVNDKYDNICLYNFWSGVVDYGDEDELVLEVNSREDLARILLEMIEKPQKYILMYKEHQLANSINKLP